MNKTSLCLPKLVLVRWGKALTGLGKGPQTASTDVHAHRPLADAQGHALHVGPPAPLGVALRETDIIAELRPRLAAKSASMGHAITPSQLANSRPSLSEHDARQAMDFSMSGRFVQTACQATR